jgi:hypothetical protein
VVEIDESKFGKRQYNIGRHKKGQYVFGGLERGSGNTFLVPVPNGNASTFKNVIVLYFIFIQQIQRVTKPLNIEHVRKVQYKTHKYTRDH